MSKATNDLRPTGDTGEQTASPELTGGAGFSYEDTVAAYYLAALLKEEGAAPQLGSVISVAVQQAGHGHPMDDVIVGFMRDGGVATVGLQVKRRVTISAADQDFAVQRGVGGRWVRCDPDIDARQRVADRCREAITRPNDGRCAGRFGQAVAVEQREAEAVQIAGDGRIDARTAGDEQAHLRSERAMRIFIQAAEL